MRAQVLAVIVCLAALSSMPAHADEASEREARALFAEGNQRLNDGDFEGALERFQRAYVLFPNPKILLNIGTTYRELGRSAEAANAYARYLEDPAAEPERRAEVEALLRELDAAVGRLQIVAPEVGGKVLVDGSDVGPTGKPIHIRVAPGKHAVTIEWPGGPPASLEITIAAAAEREIELHPAVGPAVPAEPPAATPTHAGAGATPALVSGAVALKPAEANRDRADGRGESRSHARQLGAVLRADIDARGRGLATAVGITYGVGSVLDVGVAALLARDKGVEPGATLFLLDGPLKPMVSVGVPIFFVDGARPGMRGSAGLQWDPSRWFGLFAQLGVSYFPGAPEGYESVVVLPSVGIQPRL